MIFENLHGFLPNVVECVYFSESQFPEYFPERKISGPEWWQPVLYDFI